MTERNRLGILGIGYKPSKSCTDLAAQRCVELLRCKTANVVGLENLVNAHVA